MTITHHLVNPNKRFLNITDPHLISVGYNISFQTVYKIEGGRPGAMGI
jgi:hypothetical protein